MFQRAYGGLRWSENYQKHAQSTFLDEYLWLKKNLTEKFHLEKFLEHFERTQSKMYSFITKISVL